ncbi:hypothetical protein AYO22_02163 [Fonsecaea multimorphosa]|nr:hypothetical protein AYO22_02163 [Fonsecaea multimorphosa]
MVKDLPIRVTFVYDRSVHKSQRDYEESNIWECDYKQEQLKHNGTAIALLKKEVHASAESKINRASLVNTIFLLSFLAHFRGDMQESILHRKALRTLLRSSVKQDRAQFDKNFGPLLLQFFCWMNVLEGQPNVLGIFPEDGQDHAVLSSDFDRSYLNQKNYDVDIDLPEGFRKLVTKGLISKDTQRLLARFAYGCEYGVDAVPQPEMAFPDFAVATPYLTAAEPSFEKCLVLAIFCYAHMRWASAPNLSAGILCHNISRTQLSQALHRVPKTDDTVECLVWIWIVLIDTHRVERLGFSSSAGGISCLGEFKLNFPEWDDWDRIERDILPQFFWRVGDSAALKHAWNRYPVGVLGYELQYDTGKQNGNMKPLRLGVSSLRSTTIPARGASSTPLPRFAGILPSASSQQQQAIRHQSSTSSTSSSQCQQDIQSNRSAQQDRTRIDRQPTEYSKSGTDDAVAAQAVSFSPDSGSTSDPSEAIAQAAEQIQNLSRDRTGTSNAAPTPAQNAPFNPLEVSPANVKISSTTSELEGASMVRGADGRVPSQSKTYVGTTTQKSKSTSTTTTTATTDASQQQPPGQQRKKVFAGTDTRKDAMPGGGKGPILSPRSR